ncbi:MAG: phage tail protein [Actinopolymorphaceae bacterium]
MRRPAIDRLLPAAYERAAVQGSVLGALLDVMEQLHAPDEELLARIDDVSAPYRAPDRFVPFLARWVGLEHLVSTRGMSASSADQVPVGRLRDLVAVGAELARWRGTPYGLRGFLETATGVSGFVIDEPHPFTFVVRVPASAADQIELVRRIVEAEKPAATTYDVVVSDQAVSEQPVSDQEEGDPS